MEYFEKCLEDLKSYIEKEEFKGYDPYDGLKSPFFRLPFLRDNKLIRFGTQQLVKRLPFNIRPLLFIPKGYNPVTLGLCIQAYAYLCKSDSKSKNKYLERIDFLVDELIKLIPEGFSGACWGYDFDWEARHARIPSYQPTVVATGIITNALFITYKLLGHKKSMDLIISAAEFVKNDLHHTYIGDDLCFSYSPFDKQQVLNASMKGVRLLAQSYSITNNITLKILATKAIKFVIKNQRKDGSWGYSLTKNGGWTDNYHTGYVLDCLDEYQNLTGDLTFSENIENGYKFYVDNFITKSGKPKFYNNSLYPIDCTSAAQTILTTIRFGDVQKAKLVALSIIEEMQRKDGSFKFRKFKNYTISTPFMRWSNAWMFVALSNLKYRNT